MIPLVAAASLVVAYSCQVQPPSASHSEASGFSWKQLGVPVSQWRFTVEINDGSPPIATVKWPSDPIQAEGKFPVISTGKNAYSFASVGRGPCLMTETSCLALFSIADQPDGTAKVLIEPTALGSDHKQDTRVPIVAMIEGQCSRSGTSR